MTDVVEGTAASLNFGYHNGEPIFFSYQTSIRYNGAGVSDVRFTSISGQQTGGTVRIGAQTILDTLPEGAESFTIIVSGLYSDDRLSYSSEFTFNIIDARPQGTDAVIYDANVAVDKINTVLDSQQLAANAARVSAEVFEQRLQDLGAGKVNLLNSIIATTESASPGKTWNVTQSISQQLTGTGLTNAVKNASTVMSVVGAAMSGYSEYAASGDLTRAIGVGSANFLAGIVSGQVGAVVGAGIAAQVAGVSLLAGAGLPIIAGVAVGLVTAGVVNYGLQAASGFALDYVYGGARNIGEFSPLLDKGGLGLSFAAAPVTMGFEVDTPASEAKWTYNIDTGVFTWLSAETSDKLAAAQTALGIAAVNVGLELLGDQFVGIVNDYLVGAAAADQISGLAGDDIIEGKAGSDSLSGGAGADGLFGDEGNDTLAGGDGNDLLDGGTGADNLAGGAGNDVFVVDVAGDTITENANAGTDEVRTTLASFSLAGISNVENLKYQGAAAFTGTGSGANNRLTGAGQGDRLSGADGNDILVGGAGIDTTDGGIGDDSHFVDRSSDIVIERNGQGRDFVFTSVSYTLSEAMFVEVLSADVRAATSALTLTGNSRADNIQGNAGAGVLSGLGGNDILLGFGGNDTLLGGVGIDLTNGGAGDDIHYVDSSGDTVVEAAGEGRDSVYAGVSYALREGVHVELLLTQDRNGTQAINLGGNSFANSLQGNNGANILLGNGGNDILLGNGGNDILNGGTGADNMNGGAGDDIYYVDNVGDIVVESAGGGRDSIYTSSSYFLREGQDVELLVAANRSSTAGIDLFGNSLANIVHGSEGANWIDGKGGRDVLVGYGAGDTFAFTTALGTSNVDTILNFALEDRIAVDNAIFTGLAYGVLGAAAFRTGSAAADADDRIIYNSATGALLFDADGVGGAAAVQFATMSPGLALTNADFIVI